MKRAAEAGAVLEVYFFADMVGMGKVDYFATAGVENLRREHLLARKKEFTQSPDFRAALDSGLDGLARQPRADSSSPYEREVRRLFLAWLSDSDREFLEASEGLGNSQKAEVAWLEYKKYPYVQRDVADWLQIPSSNRGEPTPKTYGKATDEVSNPSIGTDMIKASL